MKLIRITTVPLSLHKLLKGQMRFMSAYYTVIGVSNNDPLLQRVALEEGVRVVPVKMTREITLLRDLKTLWNMYLLFRKEKPIIVHTHTPKAGIAGMLAARLAKVPIRLHTVAGLPLLETSGWKRKLLIVVEKLTYSCATRIYPNSFGLKDIILQHDFTDNNKLKVIGNGSSNGIDTTYFNPSLYSQLQKEELRKSLNILADDFVFIFIGRLVKDKGINELVNAFSKMEDRSQKAKESSESYESQVMGQSSVSNSPPLSSSSSLPVSPKLLLVGDLEPELDPLLPETIEIIKTNKNIISVGWQDDVRPYLAIAGALVFPSYREGFPNVVMQAGAMGLPSIVSDINGCNEIIIEERNGVIISPKNEKILYEAMRLFIDNSDKVKRMSEQAREMITSRYEQQFVWNELLKEYRGLEAGRRVKGNK